MKAKQSMLFFTALLGFLLAFFVPACADSQQSVLLPESKMLSMLTNVAYQSAVPEYVAADHILVKFKDNADKLTKQQVHQRNEGFELEEDLRTGTQIVWVPAGKAQEKAMQYSAEQDVEFAEPDYVAHVTQVGSDPYLAQQWGLATIQAPEAWSLSTGGLTCNVAILDSGVNETHEDLSSRIITSQNFTTSPTAEDMFGHGTHVAGIVAAIHNNAIGVSGVGINDNIMNIKVIGDDGTGLYSWIAKGITWAADSGANIINLSLGGAGPSKTLEKAVNYAWSKGVLVVAAAGNAGTSQPFYPANYINCIAVAATDPKDLKAVFSNFGTWVDVAAPGVNIISTLPNHTNAFTAMNYGYLSGTSMAAPYVSGLASLLWGTPLGADNINVRIRLETTTDNIAGTGTDWVYGRINALKAVTP